MLKRFELHRHEDETGISGIGIVAEGVRFKDGQVAMRWRTKHKSTTILDSMEDVEKIHGHNGKTEIIWIDDPNSP